MSKSKEAFMRMQERQRNNESEKLRAHMEMQAKLEELREKYSEKSR
jgi:hypothetical protein